MLVYYDGSGDWCIEAVEFVHGEIMYKKNAHEQGVFELKENDERSLIFNNEAKIRYLLPCFVHKHGAFLSMESMGHDVVFKIPGTSKYFENKIKNYTLKRYSDKDIAKDQIPGEPKVAGHLKVVPEDVASFENNALTDDKKKSETIKQKKISDKDKRIAAIYTHLESLEEAAIAKGKPFDKNKLMCSRKMLIQWLQSKPGTLFNSISDETFRKDWQEVKEYSMCPPKIVDIDFFKKIQG